MRIFLLTACFLVFNLLIFSPIISSADPLDNWHVRNPLTQDNTLYGITYGNNTFVAVGAYGTILTSPDGITWTSRLSGNSYGLWGIAYGNNTFVAVVDMGSILTSATAGINWAWRSSGTSNHLNGITYGNNTFVAVGYSDITYTGTILTSADGITWTSRSSGTSNWLLGITYGNNTFVAVGGWGTILTSSDGITWTSRLSGISNALNGITYDNNTFVAVGYNGTILTSAYGITWTSRPSGTSYGLFGISYGNYTFVAVGGEGVIRQSDCLVSQNANSGSLSGKVVINIAGYSDLAVRNATVSFQGTYYSTTTDIDGNFILSNIPFGNYNLVIAAPNFKSLTQAVSLSGQCLQISLPPMTVLLGDADGNNRIGLEDAIYILQVLSGFR